jgi:branched-subunit amino acid transport protein
MNKRLPLLSPICVTVMLAAILLPFVIGAERGGQIEIQIRYLLPLIVAGLLVAALVRGEGVLLTILGFVLTGVYVALHFIATG